MAAGPAHRGRMGMDALAPAIFPDAGVGFQGELAGLAAERFQQPKQSFVAEPRQAPVEEHRHRGEDDAAIGVVLHLLGGGIADAHRPVAAIALEVGRDSFIHRVDRNDAVDRPHRFVGVGRDAQGEGDEIFHRLRRADAVERLHHEIGVAQPAIAIVPGASGARRFGDGGGVRRDDAAGLLEVAELERDGGADDLVLPVVGDGETARPIQPIVDGAVAEFAAGRFEIALKRLVDAEDEMHRPREDEGGFALDVGQRRIGGEPDDGALVHDSGYDCCRRNDGRTDGRNRASGGSGW